MDAQLMPRNAKRFSLFSPHWRRLPSLGYLARLLVPMLDLRTTRTHFQPLPWPLVAARCLICHLWARGMSMSLWKLSNNLWVRLSFFWFFFLNVAVATLWDKFFLIEYLCWMQAPNTNWIRVVENLDYEGFYIPTEEAFSFFMSVYKYACQVYSWKTWYARIICF